MAKKNLRQIFSKQFNRAVTLLQFRKATKRIKRPNLPNFDRQLFRPGDKMQRIQVFCAEEKTLSRVQILISAARLENELAVHRCQDIMDGRSDLRSVLSDTQPLRNYLWQHLEELKSRSQVPVLVISNQPTDIEIIFEKVFRALGCIVLTNSLDLIGCSSSLIVNDRIQVSLVRLIPESLRACIDVNRLANFSFMSGLHSRGSEYIIIRDVGESHKKAWNELIRGCVAAQQAGQNFIVFENSSHDTLFQQTYEQCIQSENVAIIGGAIFSHAFLCDAGRTGRLIVFDEILADCNINPLDPLSLAQACQRTYTDAKKTNMLNDARQLAALITENKLTGSRGNVDYGANYIAYLTSGSLSAPIALSVASSNTGVINGFQKYITQAFGAPGRRTGSGSPQSVHTFSTSAAFLQWGKSRSRRNIQLYKNAKNTGGPLVFVEDGFIRSVSIGLGGNPGLSFMIDDCGAYYDAINWSRIERMLLSDWALEDEQSRQVCDAIESIRRHRISKYNHAPDYQPSWRLIEAPLKLLLVDQRRGDQSVPGGLASEYDFRRMVIEAIDDPREPLVILKRHPDGTLGGKGSYFAGDVLGGLRNHPRVHFHDGETNPHTLFENVDEVWCVTSGMGFEALIAQKAVRVFGAPFYAGWGLTNDRIRLNWRNKERSIEEIFYSAYIASTNYYEPDKQKRTDVLGIIEYIRRHRDQGENT